MANGSRFPENDPNCKKMAKRSPRAILAKATAELLDRGQSAENASRQLPELRDLLGALL